MLKIILLANAATVNEHRLDILTFTFLNR